MSAAPQAESATLALRRAFDRSFAALPAEAPPFEDLLTVRAAGDTFALRLRDVAELIAGLLVAPLPSATPHLLGLAGLRGGVVPVFSLASLLGAAGPAGAPRWVKASSTPVVERIFDAALWTRPKCRRWTRWSRKSWPDLAMCERVRGNRHSRQTFWRAAVRDSGAPSNDSPQRQTSR